ncbi:MAG: cobalamin biosynthesis protein CbiA [Desulfobacterium sp.]
MSKDLKVNGIVIIVGNYGSGKTETAVNLALHQQKTGLDVSIVDLDLVNPYFRTREARDVLTQHGINVVLPDKNYMHADLPILSPKVAGIIKNTSDLTILDAGGDDVGVTVLAALANSLAGQTVQMLQVINPYRPFTETIEGCMKIKEEIELSSKLKMTGWVSNANLIDDTTPQDIYKGYDLVQSLAHKTGIPVKFITASPEFMDTLDLNRFHCPVLTLERNLTPPWRRSRQ